MSKFRAVVVAILSTGCGRLSFDAVPPDAPALDTVPACTWSAWSAPALIASVSSNADEWGPSMSADGRALYFHSDRNGGGGGFDLYLATRAAVTDAFGAPGGMDPLNTAGNDEGIEVTADDLALYLESDRGGSPRLYRSTRASPQANFAFAMLVPETAGREVIAPALTGDASELFFTENAGGGRRRLMHADIVGGVIATPQPLSELDLPGQSEGYPGVSADGLELYFAQVGTTADIVRATRPARGMPFGPAVTVPGINSTGDDDDPFISRDGTTLLFASDRPPAAGADLFVSTRSCL